MEIVHQQRAGFARDWLYRRLVLCHLPALERIAISRRAFRTRLADGVLGDVGNFVLEDKQVRRALAGEPDHALIVILNPAANHFAIHELDANRTLLFAQRSEIGCLLLRVVGRRGSALASALIAVRCAKSHGLILHARNGTLLHWPKPFTGGRAGEVASRRTYLSNGGEGTEFIL